MTRFGKVCPAENLLSTDRFSLAVPNACGTSRLAVVLRTGILAAAGLLARIPRLEYVPLDLGSLSCVPRHRLLHSCDAHSKLHSSSFVKTGSGEKGELISQLVAYRSQKPYRWSHIIRLILPTRRFH